MDKKDKKKGGRPRNYEAYKRQYKAKEKTLKANGVEMHQKMLTEKQFNLQYERILEQRKEDVASGKRKTTGNIVRTLIDRQAFALTNKQANAVLESKKQGNYYKRRSGAYIEERELELVDDYINKNPTADKNDALLYARNTISTEFFGS